MRVTGHISTLRALKRGTLKRATSLITSKAKLNTETSVHLTFLKIQQKRGSREQTLRNRVQGAEYSIYIFKYNDNRLLPMHPTRYLLDLFLED